MVSYQKFVSISFEVAKEKGMATTQENSSDLMTVAGSIWSDRKDELKTATVAQAKSIAQQEISV